MNNKSEAVKLAKNKEAAFYILDVRMGKNREQEGLDALEKIKDIDKTVFVAIFSAHEKYEKQANKLNANLFLPKGDEIQKDIKYIVSKMLNYQLEVIDGFRQNTITKLNLIDPRVDPKEDINISAYNKLKSTQEWLPKYNNQYVVFVNGNLVDSDFNQQKLLERLKDSKYRNQPKFLTKVEKNPRIIDMPSSLWLDDR